MKKTITNKGLSIIELLIAIALTSILLPVLLTALVTSRQSKPQTDRKVQASALLLKTMDELRIIRERGWSYIDRDGTFHVSEDNGNYLLEPGTTEEEGIIISLDISNALRNQEGNLFPEGTPDPSIKKVIISLSWDTPYPYTTVSEYYLTRHLNNLSFINTSEADFLTGTNTYTTVTNDLGGEVMLGSGGTSNWCNPELTITARDLPKSGVANGISAIEGFVFAGTGNNASGESFVKVSISNDNPPVAEIAGIFSNYKTNDVFGEENFGYIATDTNDREIVILNIASTPYSEAGWFNSPGSDDGQSVFVLGNTGYMTAGNRFYNFDLTQKTDERSAIDPDGIQLAGIGNNIIVVGNYAYVAVESTTTQMQIIDIATDPSNLQIVGWVNLNASYGRDVFVNSSGTRAYLATAQSSNQNEMFIIDISAKTGQQSLVSSYDTNGMNPKGITVVPGNKAIIVGISQEEYQVVNIANELSLSRCGGLNIDSGINGVSSVLEEDGDAYSYIITGDASSELKIIAGGPGGNYSNEGIFESSFFDVGYETAFNSFQISHETPPQTSLSFQIAVADVNGSSCDNADYVFVGPDKTPDTYFTGSSPIPYDNDSLGFENPGRCFKYRAYFQTEDPLQTPLLYDISVNYSP